jgi:dsDNA-binding SOS-regulon protein
MSDRTKLAAPPADPEVRRLRSAIGAHASHGNAEAAAETRRELEIHRLAEHIKRLVDGAPPLSDAQRERLALLLAPAADAVKATRAARGARPTAAEAVARAS